jgi:hypothetical protein
VLDIHGFVDVEWAGDMNCGRSTRGYVFNVFVREILWMSKRYIVVTLSTKEDEYMETTHERKEVVWLQILCLGIGLVQQDVRIYCDIQTKIF